ncbi:MAG: hypothetical protein OES32_18605 [Acidobacteriota bacterium]|nr:hypothetical protein [Acidobacteriota bacterium]
MGSSAASDSQAPFQRVKGSTVRLDPLVVEASAEVDRSLLRWMLGLSHRERLRAASNAAGALSRIRGGPA